MAENGTGTGRKKISELAYGQVTHIPNFVEIGPLEVGAQTLTCPLLAENGTGTGQKTISELTLGQVTHIPNFVKIGQQEVGAQTLT